MRVILVQYDIMHWKVLPLVQHDITHCMVLPLVVSNLVLLHVSRAHETLVKTLVIALPAYQPRIV